MSEKTRTATSPAETATPPAEIAAPPLKIASVEAIPVALPLKKPLVMAGQRIVRSYNMLVRVDAANGLTGWGEAASAPAMTGDLLPGMIAAINDHLGPLVTGQDAMRRAELAQRCAHALVCNTGAKSALDMALNDLVGRHLGVSLADLLGGAVRETLQPMYLLANGKGEHDLAEARRKLGQGFRFFKLKIGKRSAIEDANAVLDLRRQLGNEVLLCADANMEMSFAAARTFAERARDANLLFLEQPLRSGDAEGMAALARAVPTPLCGDESIGSIASIIALQRLGAIQGASIKTLKMGGVSAAMNAMTVCSALGLNISLACKLAESSLGAAATVQLGCAAPSLSWGVALTHHYLAEDITETPLAIDNGVVRRPIGPGLGVTVDEARVNKLRIPR